MPKCPKCGAEIDYLYYYAYELTKAAVSINRSIDDIEYNNWDSLAVTKGDPDYECPECGEVLFHTEGEVKEFLLSQPLLGCDMRVDLAVYSLNALLGVIQGVNLGVLI